MRRDRMKGQQDADTVVACGLIGEALGDQAHKALDAFNEQRLREVGANMLEIYRATLKAAITKPDPLVQIKTAYDAFEESFIENARHLNDEMHGRLTEHHAVCRELDMEEQFRNHCNQVFFETSAEIVNSARATLRPIIKVFQEIEEEAP